jgi:hypothetical protein
MDGKQQHTFSALCAPGTSTAHANSHLIIVPFHRMSCAIIWTQTPVGDASVAFAVLLCGCQRIHSSSAVQ